MRSATCCFSSGYNGDTEGGREGAHVTVRSRPRKNTAKWPKTHREEVASMKQDHRAETPRALGGDGEITGGMNCERPSSGTARKNQKQQAREEK